MTYLTSALAARDPAVAGALHRLAVAHAADGDTSAAFDGVVESLVQRAKHDASLPAGSALRTTNGMVADLATEA